MATINDSVLILNHQVLFRCDDGTMSLLNLKNNYKEAKLGAIIRVEIGLPTDTSENTNKPYKVWQSNAPLITVKPYMGKHAFHADPPLGSDGPKDTQRQWDGSSRPKSELYCKFWINQRECLRLPDCPYLHPSEEEYHQARKQWIDERLAARKIATHNPEDPHTSKKSHAQRAMVFAQWIQQTYGNILQKDDGRGGGVLDIAGGKGEVSMFLSHGYNIQCTVVEPEMRKRPRHWVGRIRRLTNRMVRNEDPSSTTPVPDEWPYEREPTYMTTYLDDAFLRQHTDIVDSSALLIGLHADQATEPIVDTALKLGKAFAVIPCCIFSNEFPDRRLANGQPVATTEDFIQYLCEKDTRIQRTYLGFEGKNVVVYLKP